MRSRMLILRIALLALAVLASRSEMRATGAAPLLSSPIEPDKPSDMFPIAPYTSGRTYYVRPDGGSHEQCTGLANAPYPGSGTGRPCAWDHPFRALPPEGTPRIAGGDTLVIGSGSYMMGYGAPGAEACAPDYPWDCYMLPIPSGPDPSHPTRILGQGWDSGCPDSPELWGTERTSMILNLTDASNVEVACLEITDHSGCIEFHSGGLACQRDDYPYGPWASDGIYAEDSSNVQLRHLNIHGLASAGIRAGRLTDWTVEDVRLAANGWVGWEGDIDGSDSNTGTMRFRRWRVEWNGCGETYPDGEPTGCWAQTAGGYGDGVGTGHTAGDWIIEDSHFLHNTSDGLDLLYHDLGGNIVLNRVHAEGNAGNQVKVSGQTTLTNCVLVGNCAFFEGQPFTYHVDPCRALGNALELAYTGGEQMRIINTTIYGQGDGLVDGGPRLNGDCQGSETLLGRNNIFLGDIDFTGDGEDVAFYFYQENCRDLKFDSDYSIAYRTKNITCGTNQDHVHSGPHDLCQDPLLVGPLSGLDYGMRLTANSPAVNSGSPAWAPPVDIEGRPRDAQPDRGAYEWGAGPPTLKPCHVCLPLVLKSYPLPWACPASDCYRHTTCAQRACCRGTCTSSRRCGCDQPVGPLQALAGGKLRSNLQNLDRRSGGPQGDMENPRDLLRKRYTTMS